MSYTSTDENILKCSLCPNHCSIPEGERGICNVRENRKGELFLPFYGVLSAVADDPIEKKPLYHFYPGSRILSVGFYGCSFHCPFCQNYHISQSTPSTAKKYTSPEELVDYALKNHAFGIAYTYSEPTVHFEWMLETAQLARRQGMKNVLVSNGYLNPAPAEELLQVIDAANIDLKSIRSEFYREVVGGKLEPVLAFLHKASEKIHLEITTLVIPGQTDSHEEIDQISSFIASLDPDIPLHLSCYYPTYKYNIPPTNPDKVFFLAKRAQEYLNYVYPGNVGLAEVDTHCPECNAILIRRRGYLVEKPGIRDGRCSRCGHGISFPL